MEPRTFEKKYMSRFNAQQRKAVHQVDGSVLLLAVPGLRQNDGTGDTSGVYGALLRNQTGRDPYRYLYGRSNRGYAGKMRSAFRRRSGKAI